MAIDRPCAACKYLRRKCEENCDLAPYFPPEHPQHFSNVHAVFGKSNVSKLLSEVNVEQRQEAVKSLVYEAQARMKDPIYGCVGLVSLLQQRLREIQADIESAKKELANYLPPDVIQFALANPDAFFAQQNNPNSSPLESQTITRNAQQMPTQNFIPDIQQMTTVPPQNFNGGSRGELVNCDTQHTPIVPSHNHWENLGFHDTQQTPIVPPKNDGGNFVIGNTQQQPTIPRENIMGRRRQMTIRHNFRRQNYLNDNFDYSIHDDLFGDDGDGGGLGHHLRVHDPSRRHVRLPFDGFDNSSSFDYQNHQQRKHN
ncbi:uncharacterized protein [Cicer arietinum]|uniref:Uncharacterized protein LOC101511490 n=1 Tax=Cicer arietinum TaxID=3827 RepID=A0A1S2YSF8_CICAR|nr:uncharacterized protein LOC101511490 [Cicer arietinum]